MKANAANARLIAAAPEMLEALKQAIECVTYCRRNHPDIQSGEGIPIEVLWRDIIARTED